MTDINGYKIFLETERLYLLEWGGDNLIFIFELDSDPEVMRYIRAPSQTIEDAIATQKRIIDTSAKDPRFGNWLAVKKDTGEKIGWCVLKFIEATNDIEVGYRLAKNFWGNGYATEMCRQLIVYGFEKCNLEKIYGVTHPDNIASQKVLVKSGLQFEKMTTYTREECKLFVVYNRN